VTVVLTTHAMDEAATLADRVGIMDHGRLLALDTPAALTRGLPGRTTLEVAVTLDGTPAEGLVADLGALEGVERVEQVATAGPPSGAPAGPGASRELRARLYLTGDAPLLVAPLAALVAGHQAQLTDVAIGAPSLEDVFIALTGRALR
jgi:ABC-2 type transport system ATP-binding protein